MRLSRSRRILFAATTLVLALVGIEGIARVAEPRIVPTQRDLPLPAPMTPTQTGGDAWRRLTQAQRGAVPMREDERTGWSLPPSSVRMDGDLWIRVNALGLRGPEAGPKVEGEQRLLSLGDSSIFGVGVEEKYLFTTAAAEVLATAWQRTVTPFVGGVPGYSSTQALENLRRVGPALQPDWVIIGCIWSDLYQNQDMATARRRQQIREPMRAFATWRVLRWWLSPWLASQKVRWVDGKQDIGTLDDEGYPPRTSLADYLKNLRSIVAETTKLGGKPVFLILPAPLDFDRVPPPETVRVYRAALQQVATESEAPLLDGPALFKQRADLSFFTDQVHPNRQGHQLLGKALGELLSARAPQ
jgi:lysophospholipase L1-like esterase